MLVGALRVTSELKTTEASQYVVVRRDQRPFRVSGREMQRQKGVLRDNWSWSSRTQRYSERLIVGSLLEAVISKPLLIHGTATRKSVDVMRKRESKGPLPTSVIKNSLYVMTGDATRD